MEGKLDLLVYSDSVSSNNPQEKKIDEKNDLSDNTVDQWQTLEIDISDGVSDQAINFNGITADKFYLKSDQSISIKLNGSGDAIACSGLIYMECTVSSLTISNSSGSSANITIAVGA
jgi:hypothetical protein